MRRWRNSTSLVLLPLAFLFLVAVGAILYFDLERQKQNIATNEKLVATFVGKIFLNELDEARGDLTYLSNDQELKRFVNGEEESKSVIEQKFARFLEQKGSYLMIRLLDTGGEEIVRVEYAVGESTVVPPARFQNKRDRYYFSEATSLAPGKIYVSPLDLNMEHGKIVEPRQPVIRFASPLFDSSGTRQGIIILTMNGTILLDLLGQLSVDSMGELWLLNNRGYWLAGPEQAREWAFMFEDGEAHQLSTTSPELWAEIHRNHNIQFSNDGYLHSHAHLCGRSQCIEPHDRESAPVVTLPYDAADLPWIILSRVPGAHLGGIELLSGRVSVLLPILFLIGLITLIAGMVAWRLSHTVETLQRTTKDLANSRQLLSTFVEHSPAVLFIKNTNNEYLLSNPGLEDVMKRVWAAYGDEGLTRLRADFGNQDEEVIRRGGPMEFPFTLSLPDSEQFYQILKFPIYDANGAMYAIGGITTEMTDQVLAERALEESREQFRALVESAPDAIVITNADGRIILANRRAEENFGYDRDELLQMSLPDLVPDLLREFGHATSSAARHAGTSDHRVQPMVQVSARRSDGIQLHFEVALGHVPTRDGRLRIYILRDVSERTKLEKQLHDTQKMEALGQLTGGMAHDFNNLLGIILGNLDLLKRRLGDDETNLKRIDSARSAAQRGANLTGRMLAVARRQALRPESIDVANVIRDLSEILPRTLGTDIEFSVNIDGTVSPVMVDRSEFENALLNLCINARDAMPKGGRLEVKALDVRFDKNDADVRSGELQSGDYVCISVRDSGVGIEPEVIDRVFEPFFTTKEKGHGTGLGLSMIYGFVKQSGGNIRIHSEIDKGTTVSMWLPVTTVLPEDSEPDSDSTQPVWHGSERVLVVDDEPELVEIARAYLEDFGYHVHTATGGTEALAVLDRHSDIDLLLTDVVMPGGMNGVELAQEAAAHYPGLKVLYVSGFTSDLLIEKTGAPVDAPIVTKPYSRAQLGIRLREILD